MLHFPRWRYEGVVLQDIPLEEIRKIMIQDTSWFRYVTWNIILNKINLSQQQRVRSRCLPEGHSCVVCILCSSSIELLPYDNHMHIKRRIRHEGCPHWRLARQIDL
jgi:hypothetical protein